MTVLEHRPQILGQEDDDVAACARDILRGNGITATQLRDEIYTHPSMTEAFNQLLGAAE